MLLFHAKRVACGAHTKGKLVIKLLVCGFGLESDRFQGFEYILFSGFDAINGQW